MRNNKKFSGKIEYEHSTIMDFKDVTFEEMAKRMSMLKRKFG
jgi:predicted transcriptional regulator